MKRNTIKGIARFVGSFAVSTVTGMAVKANVIPANAYQKVMTSIGSFVISGMVSQKAENYIDNTIDDIFDTIDKTKEEIAKIEDEKIQVVVSSYDGEQKVITVDEEKDE